MADKNVIKYKLNTHIQVTDVRFESVDIQFRATNARLKRIETVMIAALGAIFLLFAGMIFK
jgi:hypothetical protein